MAMQLSYDTTQCLRVPLVIILVAIAGAKTLDTAGDPLTFTCDDTGTLTLGTKVDLNAFEVKKADDSLCPARSRNLTECGVQPKADVFLYYKINHLNGNGGAEIEGGKEVKFYKISCKDKAYGVTVTAAPFKISTPNPTDVNNAKTKEVQLFFKNLPENTPVELGKPLRLAMTVQSAENKLHPQTCTAIETDHPSNKHEIWTSANCKNEASVIGSKWTEETNANATTLSIDMYAFRFISSPGVTVQCTADVCPPGDQSACTKVCIESTDGNTGNHPTGRKRRGIQTEISKNLPRSKLVKASTSFEIVDAYNTIGNSAKGIIKDKLTNFVMGVLAMTLRMLVQ